MARDPFAPLHAAYKRALVQVRRERKESTALLNSWADEYPELAPVVERVLRMQEGR